MINQGIERQQIFVHELHGEAKPSEALSQPSSCLAILSAVADEGEVFEPSGG
jgi:hypothetical protein